MTTISRIVCICGIQIPATAPNPQPLGYDAQLIDWEEKVEHYELWNYCESFWKF